MSTAQDIARSLIYRAKNGQMFYVYREVDSAMRIEGVVPFDITINNGQAEFEVLELSQDEAELQVDQWLIPRT
jgi:hypothetical protein